MSAAAESWSYDGSVGGLIELTLRALVEGRAPAFVSAAGHDEPWLFGATSARDESGFSGDSVEEGSKCREGVDTGGRGAVETLRERCPHLLGAALRAWMSEESIEPDLLAVAAAVGRRGEAALGDSGMPALRSLAASAHRVNHEIHRLIGLTRFSRRRDGLYVALLEPDHDILPAIAPAFLPRFGVQADSPFLDSTGAAPEPFHPEAFALVDLRRRYALLRPGPGIESGTCPEGAIRSARDDSLPLPGRGLPVPASFELLENESILPLLPDGSDGEEEGLWRRYFRATVNSSRRNAALQRRLMPERYWKHLAEMFG